MDEKKENNSLSLGSIIAITFGSIVGFMFFCFILYYFYYKYSRLTISSSISSSNSMNLKTKFNNFEIQNINDLLTKIRKNKYTSLNDMDSNNFIITSQTDDNIEILILKLMENIQKHKYNYFTLLQYIVNNPSNKIADYEMYKIFKNTINFKIPEGNLLEKLTFLVQKLDESADVYLKYIYEFNELKFGYKIFKKNTLPVISYLLNHNVFEFDQCRFKYLTANMCIIEFETMNGINSFSINIPSHLWKPIKFPEYLSSSSPSSSLSPRPILGSGSSLISSSSSGSSPSPDSGSSSSSSSSSGPGLSSNLRTHDEKNVQEYEKFINFTNQFSRISLQHKLLELVESILYNDKLSNQQINFIKKLLNTNQTFYTIFHKLFPEKNLEKQYSFVNCEDLNCIINIFNKCREYYLSKLCPEYENLDDNLKECLHQIVSQILFENTVSKKYDVASNIFILTEESNKEYYIFTKTQSIHQIGAITTIKLKKKLLYFDDPIGYTISDQNIQNMKNQIQENLQNVNENNYKKLTLKKWLDVLNSLTINSLYFASIDRKGWVKRLLNKFNYNETLITIKEFSEICLDIIKKSDNINHDTDLSVLLKCLYLFLVKLSEPEIQPLIAHLKYQDSNLNSSLNKDSGNKPIEPIISMNDIMNKFNNIKYDDKKSTTDWKNKMFKLIPFSDLSNLQENEVYTVIQQKLNNEDNELITLKDFYTKYLNLLAEINMGSVKMCQDRDLLLLNLYLFLENRLFNTDKKWREQFDNRKQSVILNINTSSNSLKLNQKQEVNDIIEGINSFLRKQTQKMLKINYTLTNWLDREFGSGRGNDFKVDNSSWFKNFQNRLKQNKDEKKTYTVKEFYEICINVCKQKLEQHKNEHETEIIKKFLKVLLHYLHWLKWNNQKLNLRK